MDGAIARGVDVVAVTARLVVESETVVLAGSTVVRMFSIIAVVVSSLPANVADVISRVVAAMVVVDSAGSVTSTVVGKTMVVEMLSPLPWNSVVVDVAIARGDDVVVVTAMVVVGLETVVLAGSTVVRMFSVIAVVVSPLPSKVADVISRVVTSMVVVDSVGSVT